MSVFCPNAAVVRPKVRLVPRALPLLTVSAAMLCDSSRSNVSGTMTTSKCVGGSFAQRASNDAKGLVLSPHDAATTDSAINPIRCIRTMDELRAEKRSLAKPAHDRNGLDWPLSEDRPIGRRD